MTEAASLHVIVCDFHHQFGTQRFPRQVLALAPAALPARHAFDTFTDGIARLRPCLPRVGIERIWYDTELRNSANSLRFSVLKLAQTPTCCNPPASSKSPSSNEPTRVRSPFLCQRNPATTQSQSRSCLTLSITRLFGS